MHRAVAELDRHLATLQLERRIVELIFGVGILAVAAVIGYLGFLRNHVGPRTFLAGQDISYQSRAAVSDLAAKATNQYQLTMSVGGEPVSKSADEIGITFDPKTTVDEIFAASHLSFSDRLRQAATQFRQPTNYVYEYQIDQKRLSNFIERFTLEQNLDPVNAAVEYKDGRFVPIADKAGVRIREDLFRVNLLATFGEADRRLEVPASAQPAEINFGQAQAAAAQAELLVSKRVILKADNKAYDPGRDQVAQWIDFKPESKDGKSTLTVSVDRVEVGKYLSSNVVGQVNNDKRSLDTDQATAKVADTLGSGKDVDLALPFNLKERPKPQPTFARDSSKYIEVNLSQQQIYAFSNGKLELSSGISSGKRSTATPVGEFRIWSRRAYSHMIGGTPGIDYYNLPNVPAVQYFTRQYHAFHGAYWHNEFGRTARGAFGRSHGCVNLPMGFSWELWNWVGDGGIGTPIWIHY